MTSDDRGAVDEAEGELQRSSSVFLTELDRLQELERHKRDLPQADERRIPLAHEIEDAAVGLVSLSRYQTRLIELERQDLRAAGLEPRPVAVILGEWRAAERRLYEARLAMERASDDSDRLREEHRRSVRAGR